MKFMQLEKTLHVCESCYEKDSRYDYPESHGWVHQEISAPYMSCDECGAHVSEDESAQQ